MPNINSIQVPLMNTGLFFAPRASYMKRLHVWQLQSLSFLETTTKFKLHLDGHRRSNQKLVVEDEQKLTMEAYEQQDTKSIKENQMSSCRNHLKIQRLKTMIKYKNWAPNNLVSIYFRLLYVFSPCKQWSFKNQSLNLLILAFYPCNY